MSWQQNPQLFPFSLCNTQYWFLKCINLLIAYAGEYTGLLIVVKFFSGGLTFHVMSLRTIYEHNFLFVKEMLEVLHET